MKVLFILCFSCCTLAISAQQKFDKVRTGKLQVQDFSADAEMRQWFLPEYRAYEVNEGLLEKINQYLTGKQLVLVFGSWCSDSQREVPRWIKVLNRAGFSMENMKVFGVSRNKKAPSFVVKKHNTIAVPTLVIYEKGKEVKRIVETPKGSFESDLVN
ncbi:MAG TPA: hypothetical protein VK174_12515 [Chitinophagales bacterium]|nr:hypothetical protein [Chitinophagales bacterium]